MLRIYAISLGIVVFITYDLATPAEVRASDSSILTVGDLLVVDRHTSFVTVMSPDGTIKNQVEILVDGTIYYPWAVSVSNRGRVFITDVDARAIVEVDLLNQDHRVITPNSTFPSAFITSFDMEVASNGDLLVADRDGFPATAYRIDPDDGNVTPVTDSDFANGPRIGFPLGSAIRGSKYYIGDDSLTEDFIDTFVGILEVDLQSGERRVVSRGLDTGQGPEFEVVLGMAAQSPTTLLAATYLGGLQSIDIATGDRTDFFAGGVGAGPSIEGVFAVDVGPDGTIYVGTTSQQAGLYRVDPVTRDRTRIYNNGEIVGIAVYSTIPEPATTTLIFLALLPIGWPWSPGRRVW